MYEQPWRFKWEKSTLVLVHHTLIILHLQEEFLLSFPSSSRNSFIGEWDIARCMARRISPGYFQNASFRQPAQREQAHQT
jgi:hypothetical protein